MKICGLSLRETHFADFQAKANRHKAFEVIYENFLFTEGERRDLLRDLSRGQFVHLHGVSTNIGSSDELNLEKIKNLRKLAEETNARLLSDHLCFTRIDGKSTYELLPLPRTHAMVDHIGQRLQTLRDHLGQDFLLENVSSYFSYDINEMSEAEFMAELHEKYKARFLLDANNLFVNAQNFSFSVAEELRKLSPEMIGAYHLGGFEDFGSFLFDTHGAEVSAPVWQVFRECLQLFGARPVFLERDENIPDSLADLEKELDRAHQLLMEAP